MPATKIVITIPRRLLTRLDRLVHREGIPSRSQFLQEAIREKLDRVGRARLARECAKLDPNFEQGLAEEGLTGHVHRWPEW